MPVLVARDAATGDATAWCPLNEGSGKVLRYGADDDEVVARLRWMRDVLGPALARALARTRPARPDRAAARARCARATSATTAPTPARELLRARSRRAARPTSTAFIAGNHQFFLNVAMVAAKVALGVRRRACRARRS